MDFTLNLDRPRRLVFDMDAIERLAEKYPAAGGGFSLQNIKIGFRDLPFLIYAAGAWDDPDLTEVRAKDFLNQAIRESRITMMDALSVVLEALFFQMGIKDSEIKRVTDNLPEAIQKKSSAARPSIPKSRKRGKR